MSHAFYPFVDNSANDGEILDKPEISPYMEEQDIEVRYPARIAIYDDAAAAPRIVVIEPKDVRSYLEEITSEVVRLSKEQGGTIPFMVIREVVENFIHAYFIEPIITIMDQGNTLRFSDQGPGIQQKTRALEYGTSSATEPMKQYIRGVGSGLPYAQQYMLDRGGSLTIEDNISGGTIVTISTQLHNHSTLVTEFSQNAGIQSQEELTSAQFNQFVQQQAVPNYKQNQGSPYQVPRQVYPPQVPMPALYNYPMDPAQSQTYPSGTEVFPGTGVQTQQSPWNYQMQPSAPWLQQPYNPQAPNQQAFRQQAPQQAGQTPNQTQTYIHQTQVAVSQRGLIIMNYLSQHDSVGPTELARNFGASQPTWSRELGALEKAGLIHKERGEQKRILTAAGRSFLLQMGL